MILLAALAHAAFAQTGPDPVLDHARTLYAETCAACHGLRGEGAGMPGLGIPRIDAAGSSWQLDPLDLTLLIRSGKGTMPGVGGSWSKADIAAVVALLETWWTPAQRQAYDARSQTQGP